MTILQNLAGMGDMTEQVIATDFLINAKSAVRNYAIAISETTTPEAREVLRRHLDTAITTHERILRYMTTNNYYHVHKPQEQLIVDRRTTYTALNLH
jgi:similar to spore coat protein